MRMFSGLSDVFEKEEFLVVIEDDIVIGKNMECPYSYFFSMRGGSCWGWATWRRVWKDIEWSFGSADDKYTMDIYPLTVQPRVEG